MGASRRKKALWLGPMAALVLLATPAWPQSASVYGRVLDNKDEAGIAGVTVEVVDSGNKVEGSGLSGADGAYAVGGLARGASVTVKYTKLGYVPNPKKVPKDLADNQNRQDVHLFQDTGQVRYWDEWSELLIKKIQARGGDAKAQSLLLAEEWSKVNDAGLSVEAKVRAAQSVSARRPPNTEVPADVLTYSTVDTKLLPTIHSEIGAAVAGGGKIEPQKYSLPTMVYADIAAEEITKQKPTVTQTKEFRDNLREACGIACVAELDKKLEQFHVE
jgi:hypothetical protein